MIFFRAFAADFAEEEKDRERKEAEAKDLENTKQFKEAFERIKRVVASDSSLDKIVADFIKVEDQNFALFNYVTEMNNQVEGLQESIGKLRTDIKEAKGRGDERERQQREQLQNMERRVALSIREADTAEAKLELMEGVINKLKVNYKKLSLNQNKNSSADWSVWNLRGKIIKRFSSEIRIFFSLEWKNCTSSVKPEVPPSCLYLGVYLRLKNQKDPLSMKVTLSCTWTWSTKKVWNSKESPNL